MCKNRQILRGKIFLVEKIFINWRTAGNYYTITTVAPGCPLGRMFPVACEVTAWRVTGRQYVKQFSDLAPGLCSLACRKKYPLCGALKLKIVFLFCYRSFIGCHQVELSFAVFGEVSKPAVCAPIQARRSRLISFGARKLCVFSRYLEF